MKLWTMSKSYFTIDGNFLENLIFKSILILNAVSKGKRVSYVVLNLKGSIIHIINLPLNATKRSSFLIKMGFEVFNCMSHQNTIKAH